MFDAVRYNIINYQWFCAYSYKINVIEMVSVIEFTRISHHAVMQSLLSIIRVYRQTEPPRRLDFRVH